MTFVTWPKEVPTGNPRCRSAALARCRAQDHEDVPQPTHRGHTLPVNGTLCPSTQALERLTVSPFPIPALRPYYPATPCFRVPAMYQIVRKRPVLLRDSAQALSPRVLQSP